MNKKYTLPLIISSIFLLTAALFIYSFSIKERYSTAHFIQYNSSIAAKEQTNYTIDLAYFIKKNHKDKISSKNITSIAFKNSKTTLIQSFKLVKSDSSKMYDIRNISVDVSFPQSGKEKVNYIDINFDDNTHEEYPIGDWNFNISSDNNEEKLVMSDTFPLVSNDFDGYQFSFTNTTAKDIKVIDVEVDLNETSLDKQSIMIDPQQTKKTLIKADIKNNNKFYIIKPKLSYVYDNKIYSYYPFATYYGFLSMTDDDIKKEVDKTSQDPI